ncbi:DNA (cytosine-5)-methyltransferase 1 [Paenibacillus turicensis]|uniref:Cytosine-specific methyltransferase n=1 Tax=Paenibacillus turicensis TaxID=160487 RepID=A0ABS4FUU3_9BACL|nr:DNA cytosine methyltransferase [Paenibacillus turicensis]MBP1906309.1 DNA (cytosine-5)-methyltransferase 1 [Paenibacillus turicensis]
MKIVSLFSGAGGMDLGFTKAGHEIIWANDLYSKAVETYKENIGKHICLEDIREVSTSDIPNCDMVIGGFPCQGFSVANTNRSEQDERNKLYLEFLRVIREKQPLYFIAENVKGILSLGKGKVIELIKNDFISAGYNVEYRLLNAADYGVPQIRERVIFIGVRNDIKETISFPEPTHCDPSKLNFSDKKPWVTIGQALRDIPEPEEAPHIPNHEYTKYKLRFNGYMGHRVIDPDKPSPTITARGDDKGGVVIIHHPNNHRRLSVREAATIQTFPMDFVFSGSKTDGYRQIGNAVPPLFAYNIARMFPIKVKNEQMTSV